MKSLTSLDARDHFTIMISEANVLYTDLLFDGSVDRKHFYPGQLLSSIQVFVISLQPLN
jgi:hypothetical protein